MRVLLGTASVSTAEPPRPSRSTIVTSAPSCAATSAASYPPGPPPSTTTRVRPAARPPSQSLTRALSSSEPGTPTARVWSDRGDAVRGGSSGAGAHAVYAGRMALYAAYGSNLDPDRMGARAPHSPFFGNGWVLGWRLTFGGEDISWEGALCTVVEDPGFQVFVGLYDVTPADEAAMDKWEGLAIGLFHKIRVRVQTLDGEVLAWIYVLDAYEGGLPTARYLGMLADAAEAGGAPDDYVEELRDRPCSSVHDTLPPD